MKNKFFYPFILAAMLSVSSAFAQSLERDVIGSAGRTGTGAGVTLDYTIGEPLVQTYTTGSTILTQGFHQPAEGPTAIDEVTEVLNYSVFPNPFTDEIQITLTLPGEATLQLSILDVAGRIVYQTTPVAYSAGSHTLPVNTAALAQGSYVLVATAAGDDKIAASHSKKIQLIR